MQNQSKGNSSNRHTKCRNVDTNKQTGPNITTSYEPSQSNRLDNINEECTNVAKATLFVNISNVKFDIFSQIGILRIHKLCSEENKSKQSSLAAFRVQRSSYACDVCDKKFQNSSNLAKHRNIHTGIKAYVCGFCNKKFARSSNLTRHKIIHTHERPFVCDIYEMRFNQSSNLTSHKLIHVERKPYVCELCNKASTSRSV